MGGVAKTILAANLRCHKRVSEVNLLLPKYVKGIYKKDGKKLFIWECNNSIMHNVFRLTERRFRLDIKKKVFTQRVVRIR